MLVVDMTPAFVEDRFALRGAAMGQRAVQAIRRLLTRAREIGFPIFVTRMVPFRTRAEGGRWPDAAPGIFGSAGDPLAEAARIPPELCNSGYVFNTRAEAFDLAEEVPQGPTTHAWIEVARARGLLVVAGIAERAERRLYKTLNELNTVMRDRRTDFYDRTPGSGVTPCAP